MIYVITGHICSGKTTHVRENARPGDVVIDLDRLALALSVDGTEHHDYPQHVVDVARATRWTAIDKAVAMHRAGRFNVWIVHAYPDAADMGRYRRAGATIRHMEASAAVLQARAAEGRPDRARDELARRLALEAPGVGSKTTANSDGRPHATSARISVGFRYNLRGPYGTQRPTP